MRFVDWRIYGEGLYYLAVSILSQIVLITGQWWILRKHYKKASLWLLLLVPSLLNSLLGYTPEYLFNPIITQTIISGLTLLWMNRQSLPQEKAKNIDEAEARLADNLPDEDEGLDFAALIKLRRAKLSRLLSWGLVLSFFVALLILRNDSHECRNSAASYK